uniref:Centrosomal protein kizuna n=1 Tax=Echeneis naucrates TaxID=173247 RepID=A0A665VIQ9_ECHNA
MHQREKRRLELERELFAYSRSDKRISQIKCSKLRCYLKEISDREARAKMRNLEIQRDVECIEISMKEYSPDHGPLQQQKVYTQFYLSNGVVFLMKLCQKQIKAVHRKCQDSPPSMTAKNFTQPAAVISMDSQTSRGSDVEAGTTSVHSHQALHRSPNHSLQSHERLPSGLLKDFRVGGEDATSNRAHLSDDISDSNDSPDGCNLSDKHERIMAVLPSVCALTGTAGSLPFESDDEQEPSPLVTLMTPEKNPSHSSKGPTRVKNSLPEYTNSQDVAHHPYIHIANSAKIPVPILFLLGSLCNAGADLNDVDLQACIALVLHELQRLSWSTAKGCLLPEDLVRSHQLNPDPNEISTSLPPGAALLWDRWFKHALLLKERHVLNTERLVQLFTPLLLERHAAYSHQVALETPVLPATASHYALPFLTELQSTEEDSQDESPVESVPIRGKKASLVPQHSHCPYVVVSFWGESDDSNAEIEAALRPQPFNTNSDDTDDFYD